MAAIAVILFALATLSFAHGDQCKGIITIGSPNGRQVPLDPISLPPPDLYFKVTIPTGNACPNPNGVYVYVCDPDGAAPTLSSDPPNIVYVTRNSKPVHAATASPVVFCPQ